MLRRWCVGGEVGGEGEREKIEKGGEWRNGYGVGEKEDGERGREMGETRKGEGRKGYESRAAKLLHGME